jgi:hypothetical protein
MLSKRSAALQLHCETPVPAKPIPAEKCGLSGRIAILSNYEVRALTFLRANTFPCVRLQANRWLLGHGKLL